MTHLTHRLFTPLPPPLSLDIEWSSLLTSLRPDRLPPPLKYRSLPEHAEIHLCVRSAWDLFLQAVTREEKAGSRNEVILSGINIPQMRDIVIAHGLVPVVADLNPETLLPEFGEVQRLRTSRTLGVLCSHLFGTWTELNELADWCRAERLFLVEDAAQAYMGHDFQGTAGATASLFSFGTIKRATALGGAVSFIRDPELRARMRQIASDYPEQDSKEFRTKVAKISGIKALTHPRVFPWTLEALETFSSGNSEEVLRGAVRGFASTGVPHIFRKQPCPALRLLVRARFNESTRAQWLEREKQIISSAERAGFSRQDFWGSGAGVHTFWVLPFRSREPEKLLSKARLLKYGVSRGVSSMSALANPPGTVASRILKEIVYLPVDQRQIPDFRLLRQAVSG